MRCAAVDAVDGSSCRDAVERSLFRVPKPKTREETNVRLLFLIEHGQIAGGVRNFRFNQGLIDLLNNVEALSPSVRASGEEAFDMVVPAMKVRDFNFTEVTRF